MTHAFTFEANLIVHSVSDADSIAGLTFANIKVFASPPREFWSKYVNLEFLYGICVSFLARALITSPRLLKLLLMA